jgi:transposase
LPEQITSISIEEFKSYIKEYNSTFSYKRIEEIYNLAKDSVGIKGEEESNLFELRLLLDRLYSIQETIATTNSLVYKIVKDRRDYKLLLTIRGIGPIFAASIIAEIGDISNFTAGKQLIKLAGLDLFGQQSGDSLNTLKHITKRGRKQLRTIIYQAAVSCVRLNPQLKLKYQQLLENQSDKKKKTGKALIAIACKLLRIIFRMLTENKEYDACYDGMLRSKFAA